MPVKSTNQITIVDVTDAYSVMLTSEAFTFVGSSSGAGSGQSCTTQAVAFCGTNQCSSVNISASDIICPAGISATVTNSGSAAPTVTFRTTDTIATACEATIPVVVDGITVNKKFSFAVAKAGTNGTSVTVSSTSVKYVASTSGTTAPADSASWQDSIPSVSNGQYLWTRTIVNYSDGKSTKSYTVSYKAQNGSNGTSVTISSTTVQYIASASGTSQPADTASWSTTIPTVPDGQYLWTKTTVTYSDGTKTVSCSVSYKAKNGNNGADALTLTITSSNGTIFKNSTGSTVLTAHVFKGGVEKSITDAGVVADSLGTIKWYKGEVTSSSTAVATAKTLTVSASAVTNTETYTAQLE